MKEKIRSLFQELGADLCGIANIDRFADSPEGYHPKNIFKKCKSVIVFAKAMPRGLAYVDSRIIYGKATETNVADLDRISLLGSLGIERLGGIAVPLPSDGPCGSWDPDRMEAKGLLSMRHAAVLAGIGSMGKNTLLITEKYGNMLSIGAVLTNLELESDPISRVLCLEGCSLCIDRCPTQALNGMTVDQKRCREYTYQSDNRGVGIVNCNKCRISCPRVFGTNY